MKGNNGNGNIPERDLCETNQDLFNDLNRQYKFNFDCCASKDNKKCERYSDNFLFLDKPYYTEQECRWMNPPFSKAYLMFEHFFKVVTRGVAIYRCDNMETKVWQDVILPNASWILIPKGRVAYTPFETGEMRKGMGSRFPSALIGFNVEPPLFVKGIVLNEIRRKGD